MLPDSAESGLGGLPSVGLVLHDIWIHNPESGVSRGDSSSPVVPLQHLCFGNTPQPPYLSFQSEGTLESDKEMNVFIIGCTIWKKPVR